MQENVLSLLLQTESEYHSAMKHAVKEAEAYVDRRREEQTAYIEEQKRKLLFFEEFEGEALEQKLIDESARLEEEAAKQKDRMRKCQEDKADRISTLLKEEVLSLLWQ